MFYLNNGQELTLPILVKMINKFYSTVEPKLIANKKYYDGIQNIQYKSYADSSKPCHRSVTNYCKNIADSYCGYLAAPGYISYKSEHDIDDIMDVLKYNDYQTEDSNFLLDALVYGVAAELMYIDKEGKTRFKLINPVSCFGVYDDSLTGDLRYFVRIYKRSEWDSADVYCIDVYSDAMIQHYTMIGRGGQITFEGQEPHYFNQCPANIFYLQDEKSIFDCIVSLQDAYNELLSDEIDDYSAFCDAYLTLIGVEADADDIASMKQNRVLMLPEGADASWLTKNANDAQVENILKRIQESIYRIAQCPDFSSESFVGGVSSGIAIRYRLTGMETRASKIASAMKQALQRRIEIICGIASLTIGEEVFSDIEIDFSRNIPEDETAVINMVNSLRGLVSDATLLGQLPFVSDVNKELDALKLQKEENMSMYSFGVEEHEHEEDEEEN